MTDLFSGITRCLLVQTKFSDLSFWNYQDVCRIVGKKYPAAPLGMLTVAAILPQHWKFRLIDENVEPLLDEHLHEADLVCIGGMLPQQNSMLELIGRAHAMNCTVVMGGPDPTSQPELYREADFLVLGEGEITIPMFLDDLKKGALQALVTAPINKKNIQSADFNFPGHTEYLEKKFGTNSPALMMLVNDVMRVAVVTGHIPLDKVSKELTEKLIVEKLIVLNNSLKKDFRIIRPRIAVLGLNPHSGDNGVIGNEEQTVIIPAMKQAEAKGIITVGPYPADGFFGSGNVVKFDAVLAMYHDQGLIPFKTISMDSGVNYTAGLSVIRTSPDHGTAYDIAGQNIASEESFRQAMYLAYDIYQSRNWIEEISVNPLIIEQRSERRERGSRVE